MSSMKKKKKKKKNNNNNNNNKTLKCTKCLNLRRKWIEREQEKTLLIYRGIRSLGKRREKGEEKEEGRKKSLIRIIIATIIRPNNWKTLHGIAIY